jgi:hypothetical protein
VGPDDPVEPCPECSAGKCDNCDGTTWDNIKDERVPCPCHAAGHRNLALGKRLRDAGIEKVKAGDEEKELYKLRFTYHYNMLLLSGRTFMAEDVVALAGKPPGHPNLIGALMSGLVKRDLSSGVIEYAGYQHASKPSSHGRRMPIYIRADYWQTP